MDATRHEGLDVLRALAAFFVIGIHTSGRYLAPEHWQSSNGYVAALVQGFVQIGVPLFFVLSGAFLLAQPIEKPSTFYRKRLPRLLIPLAVWLPLYYLYFWIKGADVAEYALHLFWAKGYFHLWFLPPLLGLYLVTPLLRKLIERVSRSRRLSLIALALLLLEEIGSLFLFVYQVELPILILFIPYLGYYLLGYVLKEHALAKKSLWGVLYGTSTLAMITLLMLYYGSSWAEYVTSNLSPLVAMATISLFALFSSRPHLAYNSRFLGSFAARSLGVYLIHIVVLDVVTKPFLLWFPSIMEQALLSILLRWSLTAVLSFIVVSLLQKVRLLRLFL